MKNKNYKIAIFPGSFNRFHEGHISVISKAINLFETIYVVISNNPNKKMENMEIREKNIIESQFFKDNKNKLKVIKNDGLTSDVLNMINCYYIIRGVRDKNDFEYELKLYDSYKKYSDDFEIIYFFSNEDKRKISSTLIKERMNEN